MTAALATTVVYVCAWCSTPLDPDLPQRLVLGLAVCSDDCAVELARCPGCGDPDCGWR